jgi:hypothetical protein
MEEKSKLLTPWGLNQHQAITPTAPNISSTPCSSSNPAITPLDEEGGVIPLRPRRVGVFSLVALGFFWVSGGIYGNEALVLSAPPSLVLIALLIGGTAYRFARLTIIFFLFKIMFFLFYFIICTQRNLLQA